MGSALPTRYNSKREAFPFSCLFLPVTPPPASRSPYPVKNNYNYLFLPSHTSLTLPISVSFVRLFVLVVSLCVSFFRFGEGLPSSASLDLPHCFAATFVLGFSKAPLLDFLCDAVFSPLMSTPVLELPITRLVHQFEFLSF